ncbi:MAG: diaminopimelate decarboxylase [Candidatus Sericytochromatia bacterium]|nr:diaminopimelate decarboxylase [Candidatus Sericytochromatia bacterium]
MPASPSPTPSVPNAFRPASAADGPRGWTVGGLALGDLADRFGTPLWVLDAGEIRDRALRLRKACGSYWPGPAGVVFASKAHGHPAVAGLVAMAGAGIEAVSLGEIEAALAAGIAPAKLVLQGHGRSADDYRRALALGVRTVHIDALDEIPALAAAARTAEARVDVRVRVLPGITAATHPALATGIRESKFGLPEGPVLDEAIRMVRAEPSLHLQGLQLHVGSQIHDLGTFEATAAVAGQVSASLLHRLGWSPEVLDLGGGLGVPYLPDDPAPTPENWVRALAQGLRRGWPDRTGPWPTLVLEPGRWLVANAGCTVYRILSVKSANGCVIVDGGLSDNPRIALYDANYVHEPVLPQGGHLRPWRLAGRTCEEGDELGTVNLEDPVPGQLVVGWCAGAYHYPMASRYNRLPRPPLVLVDNGRVAVASRRETEADLSATESPRPDWFTA